MEQPKSKRGGYRPGAGRKPKAALNSTDSNAPAQKPKLGAPTEYKPEFAAQAQALCKLGATDQELADFFGVSARTIYRWKAQHEVFCQSLKVGKAEADERVERSLFARANGYEHDEVDIRVIANQVVQTKIRKFYPPDTTAAIFWLKNRRPAEWRDKVELEHSGTIAGKATDAELDAAIKEHAERLGFTLQ